ncbi:hypothetical protein SLS58_011230 [Diplodia intermedia]|uniref:DUF7924 domain-containing protein n=1 Tax=Diplodia intermedia TaxID=856260 RepID=A0ABR3T146_9PEZI
MGRQTRSQAKPQPEPASQPAKAKTTRRGALDNPQAKPQPPKSQRPKPQAQKSKQTTRTQRQQKNKVSIPTNASKQASKSNPASKPKTTPRKRKRSLNLASNLTTGPEESQKNRPRLSRTVKQPAVAQIQPTTTTAVRTAPASTSSGNWTTDWVLSNANPTRHQMAMARPQNKPVQKLAKPTGSALRNELQMDVAQASSNGVSENGDSARETTERAKKTKGIYKSKVCRQILERGNSNVRLFMAENELFTSRRGPTHRLNSESEGWIGKLQKRTRNGPDDARYQTKTLTQKLLRLQPKNEVAVIQTIHDLVCPVAEDLADLHLDDEELGDNYDLLADLWDEPWGKVPSLPGFGVPRPDYCVGFSLSAFGEEQRKKLEVIADERKFLLPTPLIYFPFLTCEAKSWQQSIDIAENQNAYNIFVAVQAMVELFRMAKYDVNGKFLAFSVSYRHDQAYWHAYYPVINGEKTDICRRVLCKPYLSPADGDDSWKSWNLARNVYELWAPQLFRCLCEAIDSVQLAIPPAEPANVEQAPEPAPSSVGDRMDTRSEATARQYTMSEDDFGDSRRAEYDGLEKSPPPKRPRVS